MGTSFILVDVNNRCIRYIVKRKGVLARLHNDWHVPEPETNHPVYKATPEYLICWFLARLENDMVFRLRCRSVLKSQSPPVVVQLTESRCLIDMKSCEMSLESVHECVELLTMLSWFSTFGGAYSNLGDEFEKCAEMAGKISVHQMKLAFQLGDPFLVARCKLYYSIALIQRGLIRPAKEIVRSQYRFAKQEEEFDPKLLKMCLGIWSKLVYTKQQQRGELKRSHGTAIKN